jgi:hypothetical protein
MYNLVAVLFVKFNDVSINSFEVHKSRTMDDGGHRSGKV